MNFFRQLGEQLAQIYQGMSWPRRIGLLALTVACLAVIVGVVLYAMRPDYRVLYSGLEAKDAGAITDKLQTDGIPYRLAEGGSTILVPADQVHRLRLKLAVDGMPGSVKGFELFDDVSFGMTPFVQQVNYARAIQAELAKSIMEIEQVAFARVHIVQPEKSPFVREQKPSTASVVLKLKPGAMLNRGATAGVVALVARAVEGLAPDNVTILDTTGRILSENRGKELSGPITSQLDYRRDLEAYLSSRAEEMLAQVLGPGHAIVRVTADVNFQRQTLKKESYDPTQKVLYRETISTRKTTDKEQARGIAGAASNLPRGTGSIGSSGTGKNETSEEITSEWHTTKILQELDEGRGTIERLTVAALIDLTPEDKAEGQTLTVADAQDIVKRAVGFKEGRDEITVSNAKLAGAEALENVEKEYQEAQRWQRYFALARNISLGMAALVALLLGFFYLRRLQSRKTSPTPSHEESSTINRLVTLAEEDPDVVAQLLASWMDEGNADRAVSRTYSEAA